MRARLGRLLRRWADRIDPARAAKPFTWTFTYERSGARGAAVTEKRTDGRGCPLWIYVGDEQRAFDEADSDWRSPEEKLADVFRQFGEDLRGVGTALTRAFGGPVLPPQPYVYDTATGGPITRLDEQAGSDATAAGTRATPDMLKAKWKER